MINLLPYFGTDGNGISITITKADDIEAFRTALHRGLNTMEDAPVQLRSLDDILQHGTDLELLKHNPRQDNESTKSPTTEVSNRAWGLTDEQLREAGIVIR